jgi:hypothetical protein
MDDSSILRATCHARHAPELFHLYNRVVDRAVLGHAARSLRFLGSDAVSSDRSQLRCRFRVAPVDGEAEFSDMSRPAASSETGPSRAADFRLASFNGIDFNLVDG